MQKILTWIGVVIALGSIWLFGQLVVKMFSWFTEAKADVKLSVVSAVLTALAAVITVLIAKKKEKEADFQRAQYQDKLSTYQQFVENVIAKLFLNAPQKFKNEKEQKQFVRDSVKWSKIAAIASAISVLLALANLLN